MLFSLLYFFPFLQVDFLNKCGCVQREEGFGLREGLRVENSQRRGKVGGGEQKEKAKGRMKRGKCKEKEYGRVREAEGKDNERRR